jgi:hypothetical protein
MYRPDVGVAVWRHLQDFDMVDSLGRGRVDAFYLGLTADAALGLFSSAFDLADSAV